MWFEVLNILILIFVLRWIKGLSKCDCAKGLSRDFMQFYFSAGLVFQFATLLGLDALLDWPMAGLAVAYGFVALWYIKKEKEMNCECAGRILTPQFFWLTFGQTAWALSKILLRS